MNIDKVWWNSLKPTGCPKKNASKVVWIKSPATNILDDWDISHLKDRICSSVWSTKTFLYDIWELRYKQNNMCYHLSKIVNIEQSSVLKSDTQYCFPYISWYFGSSMLCWSWFELEKCLWMSPLKWNMFKSSKIFKAKKIMYKLWRYQISIL